MFPILKKKETARKTWRKVYTNVLYRVCENVIKGQKGLDSSRKIIKRSLKIVYLTLPSTLLAPGMFTTLYILAILI